MLLTVITEQLLLLLSEKKNVKIIPLITELKSIIFFWQFIFLIISCR